MTESKAPKPTRRQVERELLWRNSRNEAVFFLDQFWSIITPGVGYRNFDPWEFQPDIISSMQSAVDEGAAKMQYSITNPDGYYSPAVPLENIELKARQIGLTTMVCGVATWDMIFHEARPWLLVSTGEDEAKASLKGLITNPYSRLPAWLRKRGPAVETETTEVFAFDNGSSIEALPSTAAAGRGKAVFGVIFDEAAFMLDAGALYAALEPLCYGPMFILSTANGMGNWYHGKWEESQQPDSDMGSRFSPWWVVPGRTEEWYEAQKRKYRTQPHMMAQEYPATPEEAFSRSGRTVFDVAAIDSIGDWRPPDHSYDLSRWIHLDGRSPEGHDVHGQAILELSATVPNEVDFELRVWEQPTVVRHPDHTLAQMPNYVLSCDVSEGLPHGDYSAGAVLNVNNWEVVATFKCHLPIYSLGRILSSIGLWYYEAMIIVERNNQGLVPLAWLYENGYRRLYRMEALATIPLSDRTPRFGWHTNRASKPLMIQEFAAEVAAEALVLHDAELLAESRTFLSDGKGGGQAFDPNHDDLLMGHLLAVQGGLDIGEYPVMWQDPAGRPLTMGDVLSPMGYGEAEPGSALARPIGNAGPQTGPGRGIMMPLQGGSDV
jgi:hypothetical protein